MVPSGYIVTVSPLLGEGHLRKELIIYFHSFQFSAHTSYMAPKRQIEFRHDPL